MTKQDEIDLFRKFVADLPQDSYLWNYLHRADDQFEQLTKNDFFGSLPQRITSLQQEVEELEKKAAAMRAVITRLTVDATELNNAKSGLLRGLDKLAEEARQIGYSADNAAARARKAGGQ